MWVELKPHMKNIIVSESIPKISSKINPITQSSNLECCSAISIEEVETAWGLVYQRYSQMGLIHENEFEIHTSANAVGEHSCVIFGSDEKGKVNYTMTLFRDNLKGFSLDSVYGDCLDEFRKKGRRMLEVGLLAERGDGTSKGARGLLNMMRWAINYGLHHHLTDIIIGVHPRHAQFYIRRYGFEIAAPPTVYPNVRNASVVLLCLPLQMVFSHINPPKGLVDVRDNPLPREDFFNSFDFKPAQLVGSKIDNFLKSMDDIALATEKIKAEFFSRFGLNMEG